MSAAEISGTKETPAIAAMQTAGMQEKAVTPATSNSKDDINSMQGWEKLVLIALERYSIALKHLTFNLR
jgi:hypothetical protein